MPAEGPAATEPAREAITVRTFPVPREALFDAFADPARLAQWWGPAGFTNEFHAFDLRPGGRWRFDMRGPDGTRYPQEKTFIEVVRPSRIVLHHPQVGHDFLLTLTLDEVPGGTRLTWRMRFASPEEFAAVEKHIVAGNEENLDRLEAHLGLTPAAKILGGLKIERTLQAPRERVFRAWTEPEQLMRWWAPDGATTPHCTVDLRVGGRFHYCMRFEDGKEMWALGIYREVAPPERLVFLDSFADKEGNAVAPAAYGMSPDHPAEALVTITFDAPTPTSTRITLHHALSVCVPEREGIRQGWTEMLARLAAHLEA